MILIGQNFLLTGDEFELYQFLLLTSERNKYILFLLIL